jgi:hypothetical protein
MQEDLRVYGLACEAAEASAALAREKVGDLFRGRREAALQEIEDRLALQRWGGASAIDIAVDIAVDNAIAVAVAVDIDIKITFTITTTTTTTPRVARLERRRRDAQSSLREMERAEAAFMDTSRYTAVQAPAPAPAAAPAAGGGGGGGGGVRAGDPGAGGGEAGGEEEADLSQEGIAADIANTHQVGRYTTI